MIPELFKGKKKGALDWGDPTRVVELFGGNRGVIS